MNRFLKPCPFCGSNDIYDTFEYGLHDETAIIFCNTCKISVKLEENNEEGNTENTRKKAAEAWNRREEQESYAKRTGWVFDLKTGWRKTDEAETELEETSRKPKVGKWKWLSCTYDRIPREEEYECSECGHKVITHGDEVPWEKYCPNCGTKMENENK